MNFKHFPIIITNFKPFGQHGVTIGPFILVWLAAWEERRNALGLHERIHRAQWLEILLLAMLPLTALVVSLGEYLDSIPLWMFWGCVTLIWVGTMLLPWALVYYPLLWWYGYDMHPMEREARMHEHSEGYLITRQAFAWLRWL